MILSLSKHIRQLFEYRELIYNLVIKELKERYRNSLLGFVWSLLNPLGMMLVFTVVFTVMMPSYQVEKYPIFLLCGLIPWQYLSNSVNGSMYSIVGNANLVKKVYFPREVLPIAGVLAQLVNFLLSLIVLFVILIIFQSQFSPWLWLLPVVILLQTCFTIGLALILSTMNVFYRDTAMVMDVFILAWFFLTPIFYPLSTLPQSYDLLGLQLNVHRLMYILNPMASLINAYRDLLYGGYRTDFDFFLRTAFTSIAVMIFGYWFFVRYSSRLGEEV